MVLLLGMAAGVACVLIAKKLLEPKKSGVGGLGDGADIPPPNAPWANLGVKPMEYGYTGWNPPAAYQMEAQKLAARRQRARGGRGMGMGVLVYPSDPALTVPNQPTSSPLALTQYPQYPTSPQTYAVEEPIDWRSPQIDARFSSEEMDAF